jgi:hypothetical protein
MIQSVTKNFLFSYVLMVRVSITPCFIGVYLRGSAVNRFV